MSQKPTLNQADIDLLNQLLHNRFAEQQKYIDKRFDILPEQIENIARQVVREEAVTKEELREELKHLPTKEEYYSGQDNIMNELKTVREEQSAHMRLHDRIEKRLSQAEKKLGLSSVIN